MSKRTQAVGLAAHLIALKPGDNASYFFTAFSQACDIVDGVDPSRLTDWALEYFPNDDEERKTLPAAERIPCQSVDERVLGMCFLTAIAEDEDGQSGS